MKKIGRRDFLIAMGIATAGTAVPMSISRALAIPANNRTGTIEDVEHIVILMQENRSFDHYFGTLRGVRGFGDPRAVILPSGKSVWNQNAWLFPSEKTTKPIRKDNLWRRYIKPKLKDAGLDWIDFHVLRRTHSSLMRELNVDPKLVADQQGHTMDVNINVYTQTSLESRIEAVNTLQSALIN